MEFDKEVAGKLLGHTFAKMYSKDAVMNALGMLVGDQDEKFWLNQKFTVITRFQTYCLHMQGLPLTLERTDLSMEEFALLTYAAQALLREGLDYTSLYRWWRETGQDLHTEAYEAKRRYEALRAKCIRVMLFYEGTPPKYLLKGENGYAAVDSPGDATTFNVFSEDSLTKESLANFGKSYESPAFELGAKSVKAIGCTR